MEKPIIAAKGPKIMNMGKGKYFWCACGRSKKGALFCDGSHKGTGIQPVRVLFEKPQEVAWCMCKQTKTPPFCDGSHNDLK